MSPTRYMRARWAEIDALCRLNSIPFNLTGEKIREGGLWHVCEFSWQMDAILFWDRFEGRWLRGSEFHYPERPKNLPSLKPLQNWPKFDPRQMRCVACVVVLNNGAGPGTLKALPRAPMLFIMPLKPGWRPKNGITVLSSGAVASTNWSVIQLARAR